MNEYEWVLLGHPKSSTGRWGLRRNGISQAWYLVKGGRKNPGWVVWRGAEVRTRLNPNLTLDEAQSAAKMLAVLGAQQ